MSKLDISPDVKSSAAVNKAQCGVDSLKLQVNYPEPVKTIRTQSNKKPANYVERISQDYAQDCRRIDMIHKKNLKRQEALKRTKTELIP